MLVVVDRLSKCVLFSALIVDYSNKLVAKVFMKTVVRLHGTLNTIVSDGNKVFTNQFWQQLFR